MLAVLVAAVAAEVGTKADCCTDRSADCYLEPSSRNNNHACWMCSPLQCEIECVASKHSPCYSQNETNCIGMCVWVGQICERRSNVLKAASDECALCYQEYNHHEVPWNCNSPAQPADDSGLSTGAIAGISVGAVAFVGLIAAAAVCL